MLYQNLRKENIISIPKSFEWFKNELSNNNINSFTIVGEYKNMSTHILVRCNECGNEWEAMPQHLLRGHGCRKCALKRRNCSKNKRKTTNIFINELRCANPTIIVVGEYLNAHTPISCECSICHYKWSPRPANLLSGYGCPRCGDYLKHNKQVKSKTDFVNAMKIVNPFIKIIGEYKNTHTAVKCECEDCGFVWCAMPSNLLRGTGCPKHNASHGENAIMRWLDEHSKPYIHQQTFTDLVGIGGRKLPYDFFIPEINTVIEY